jgi:hypothetical protein
MKIKLGVSDLDQGREAVILIQETKKNTMICSTIKITK